MSSRPTSELLVSALVRRVNGVGGSAMVLQRGDAISGTLLVQISDRGVFSAIYERLTALDGSVSLARCGPENGAQDDEIINYIQRRTRSDPDLWLIELDVANGERLAAETIAQS
jgi:hypothetical protein